MKKGSPLLVYTNRLLEKLKASKSKRDNMYIDIAMRYGKPNIKDQLLKFKEKNSRKIKIINKNITNKNVE